MAIQIAGFTIANVAEVKPASTAPVAADNALVVNFSPNGAAAIDRSQIVPGTTQGLLASNVDRAQIARLARSDEDGTQRVTSENFQWHDALEGSTVNAFWTQALTNMTIAQATGVLTLNNSGITTAASSAIITSQRQIPKYPRQPINCRFRGNISADVVGNHTLVELGLGAPTGVTPVINNGAFFRWRVDGTLAAVLSYNGTEEVTQVLAQGLVNTNNYYEYMVVLDDDFARFVLVDASNVPLVDKTISITATFAANLAVSHIPSFARVYTDATGGGTVIKLNISAHSVQLMDADMAKPWPEQMSAVMRQASINPTTYAQTGSSMTAAPATETPSNTVGGYAFLGGDYAVALTVASENPLSVFAFQIPSPYSFYLKGLTFMIPLVTTAISVTGVPSKEWLVIANCASGNISTGGGQRFPIGVAFTYTSITQAAGTFLINEGNLMWAPEVPILCLPGTFLHLAYKVFTTSAAGTPGVTRGSIFVDGYFE